MQKAYDFKDLAGKLKDQGLPLAEDAAEKVYKAVKEWTIESAQLSENSIDDFGVKFFDYVDDLVLPQIDKIDGQPG
jgi:hypothetical protein